MLAAVGSGGNVSLLLGYEAGVRVSVIVSIITTATTIIVTIILEQLKI